MAGLLPGDPSHHGMAESGIYSFARDKLEEPDHSSSNWYLSRKEIEDNSPSRRDGIDLKKETYFRRSYCTFLQDLGMRLKVPQVTIATAIIFCHRFFLRQSHAKNDRRTIATVCMFLAGKVEETPRPLKDVILVSYEIIHKKDPAAVQRIKQKEVYEQQKELILLGERVVLATLGFELNVHHPYKPLVEAIKKFKVAQNALAQVAWNFVNDGLRTSLCLQFKPHHIAAGAIFLAAKFLKVKLPSDGEKVWWQEFDVTPRQLEEVSNQMLELYEQNHTVPHGNEVDGNGVGGASHRAPPSKTPSVSEEPVLANGHLQAGGAATVKHGGSVSSSAGRHGPDQSYADSLSGPQRSAQNLTSDGGGSAGTSDLWDHTVDDGGNDSVHREQDKFPFSRDNIGEASNRSKNGSELTLEESGRNDMVETADPREWKDEGPSHKSSGTVGQVAAYEGQKGHCPPDAIRKIDREKVKAALEKRKKSRNDPSRKTDLMDENDILERELENGVELAAEDEKIKRAGRQSWSKPLYKPDSENLKVGKVHSDMGDRNALSTEQFLRGSRTKSRSVDLEDAAGGDHGTELDEENAEEGELSFDTRELYSPKSGSRHKRAVSPDKHFEGRRVDYLERDHKRHRQENFM